MKKLSSSSKVFSVLFLAIALVISFIAGRTFLGMDVDPEIHPGPGVTDKFKLSKYNENLNNSPGNTNIYVLGGKKPGATGLILGGTHPDEPAGQLSAILLIENATVEEGKLIVIPRANRSAFTHTAPLKGAPQHFSFRDNEKSRGFRYGSRLSNPVHQWPDPTIFINPAGLRLAGETARNLNRSYPGDKDGYLTERIAYAIMRLIREENVDIAIDLHESSPEYPVTKAIVAHPNAMDTAALAKFSLAGKGLDMKLESSPETLGGLSHREWGDHSSAKAFLIESPNPIQGRLRGRTDVQLLKEGRDKFYRKAADEGRLYVKFGSGGWPIEKRVGIHISTIKALMKAYSSNHPDSQISFHGAPDLEELEQKGISPYFSYGNQ